MRRRSHGSLCPLPLLPALPRRPRSRPRAVPRPAPSPAAAAPRGGGAEHGVGSAVAAHHLALPAAQPLQRVSVGLALRGLGQKAECIQEVQVAESRLGLIGCACRDVASGNDGKTWKLKHRGQVEHNWHGPAPCFPRPCPHL